MTRLLVAAAMAATAAGLVHVFRNRLLAPILPRVIAELRRRFGDGADVRSATLDERWNLVLEGVRVPLPAGILVEVEHAVISGVLALSLPGGLANVRVREARGLVALVGDEHALAALALPFVYRLDAGETRHPLQGTLEVRDGTWAHRRDDRPSTPYLNADVHVTAGADYWMLDGGRIGAGDAQLELEAHGSAAREWSLRARFMGVGTGLLEHVLALVDPTLEVELPAGLQLTGLLERAAGGPVKLRAEAATAGSSVVADLQLGAERELSGKLTGKVALAEVARAPHGHATTGLHPLPTGELMLDARVSGLLTDPSLSGTAFLAALELATGDPATSPVLRFFDVSMPFDLSTDRLAVRGLTANAVAGKLMATSAVQFGIWPVQHDSELRWEGVRLEQLPTGAGGAHALNALIRGASTGHARVYGQGGDLELLTAEGEIQIDEPDYLFLRRLEQTLSGYGLPVPPTHGTAPCRARLALSQGMLDVTGIAGSLQGLSFAGDVRARLDRAVSGRLTIRLEPSYLAKGGALAMGAGLGPLDVPLTISGSLPDPQITVDVAKAIGGFLRGKGMANMVGALGNMLSGPRPAVAPAPAPPVESERDRLLGGILAGGPEADRLMDRLIATGVSPDEVRDMLADYRRRRGL